MRMHEDHRDSQESRDSWTLGIQEDPGGFMRIIETLESLKIPGLLGFMRIHEDHRDSQESRDSWTLGIREDP